MVRAFSSARHRCLRRIKEMQENGGTILFVSYDPSAVKALCTRAILLNAGRVDADGKPSDVLNRYQGLIMEREQEYEAAQVAPNGNAASGSGRTEEFETVTRQSVPLRYAYLHGGLGAEIVTAE